jgi:putative ABC transport system ATP-binding protein
MRIDSIADLAPASPDPAEVVRLAQVSKQYPLGRLTVNALQAVDLVLQRGEFAALWGPSGSGKTSLLNLIGLIDSPSAGSIRIAGKDPSGMSDHDLSRLRNRHIGFVFQHFNLIGVLSALDNVALPLQLRGMGKREARVRAADALAQVQLADKKNSRPDTLSGGQRQRVALARALAGEPELVVADEPTANLDAATSTATIELMRSINRERGVTFLFSTHDPRLIDVVDRLIRLEDGRIVNKEPLPC